MNSRVLICNFQTMFTNFGRADTKKNCSQFVWVSGSTDCASSWSTARNSIGTSCVHFSFCAGKGKTSSLIFYLQVMRIVYQKETQSKRLICSYDIFKVLSCNTNLNARLSKLDVYAGNKTLQNSFLKSLVNPRPF